MPAQLSCIAVFILSLSSWVELEELNIKSFLSSSLLAANIPLQIFCTNRLETSGIMNMKQFIGFCFAVSPEVVCPCCIKVPLPLIL